MFCFHQPRWVRTKSFRRFKNQMCENRNLGGKNVYRGCEKLTYLIQIPQQQQFKWWQIKCHTLISVWNLNRPHKWCVLFYYFLKIFFFFLIASLVIECPVEGVSKKFGWESLQYSPDSSNKYRKWRNRKWMNNKEHLAMKLDSSFATIK